MNNIIRKKLKELPTESGVYIMMNADKDVIYVGKAVNLKNRVSQYFHSSGNKTEKTIQLVNNITDFRYIITNNEVDALVLENNLIKRYTPKYNILLKDDKSYPFIKINLKQKYPRIEVTRKLKEDGAKYFGPYMQGVNTRDIMELIHSAFPVRQCNLDLSKIPANHRPCLNSHIGRCIAPCTGDVTEENYNLLISAVINFLKGNDNSVKEILESKMENAVSRQDFELAIYYRDQLKVLDKLIRQQISALPKMLNMDIFAIKDNGVYLAVSVLIVRSGKLIGGNNYPMTSAVEKTDITIENDGIAKFNAENFKNFNEYMLQNMLAQFILQFYEQTPHMPDEIVVNEGLESQKALEKLLFMQYKQKINILHPQMGVRKQLVDMAANNAQNYLDTFVTKMLKRRSMTEGAVENLYNELHLKNMPNRIECYDISHISGTDKVASMVVFKNGERANKLYRRFKIKTVEGNNDFASMYECLNRRFKRLKTSNDDSFSEKPDLIVVDGGKGQLKYALKAMQDNDVDLEIISLAKREEEVFLPNRTQSVMLPRRSLALSLLQRVRDEAHRFAISYHKRLRARHMSMSELKNIEGIGDKKMQILYNHYKTINKIKKASVDDLAKIKGISKTNAKAIVEYFTGQNN